MGLVIPSSEMNLKINPSIGELKPSFWYNECFNDGFNNVMTKRAKDSLLEVCDDENIIGSFEY